MEWALYLILLQCVFFSVVGSDDDDTLVPNQYIVRVGPGKSPEDVLRDIPGSIIAREYILGLDCKCVLVENNNQFRDAPPGVDYAQNRFVRGLDIEDIFQGSTENTKRSKGESHEEKSSWISEAGKKIREGQSDRDSVQKSTEKSSRKKNKRSSDKGSTTNNTGSINKRNTNNNERSSKRSKNRDEGSTNKGSTSNDEESTHKRTKKRSMNRDEKSATNKRSTPSNGASCYKQETGKNYWGLSRISSVDLPHYDTTAVNHSYEFSNGGDCVDIYVVDSGVNVQHKTFGGRAVLGYTARDLYKEEGSRDLHGHGTHVAALAAGRYHGTAKRANVIAVKVLDKNKKGKLCWLIEGLEWITQHIKHKKNPNNYTSIINVSLGVTDLQRMLDFLDECLAQIPAVFVGAAGNENTDACHLVPARFPSVITVGATNIHDRLMYYDRETGTNYGKCVDILAPGDRIRSASHLDYTSEKVLSGTSSASGFVSGVAAMLVQQDASMQGLTTADVKRMLQRSAVQQKVHTAMLNTPDLLVHVACQRDDANGAAKFEDFSPKVCRSFATSSASSTWRSSNIIAYNIDLFNRLNILIRGGLVIVSLIIVIMELNVCCVH